MARYLQVSTVTDSHDAATSLLRSAVHARLAASGQVFGPAKAVFRHEGKVGEGEEWQVFLKTTSERYPELEAHLTAEHLWNNPEITFTSVDGGSAPYLEWVRKTTT